MNTSGIILNNLFSIFKKVDHNKLFKCGLHTGISFQRVEYGRERKRVTFKQKNLGNITSVR